MRRSMLFMPGNTPNMIINAAYLGADSLILDLEDAVSPAEKDAARILIRNALKYLNFEEQETIVRINSIDTPFWQEDIVTILPEKPNLLLLPKANRPEDILLVDKYMAEIEEKSGLEIGSVGLIPLIETALGLENSFLIATASKRVKAMLLGAEDLTADLQCVRTKQGKEIEYARGRIVVAARAAGIDVYDTPFTDVNDEEGIIVDTKLAKGYGFTGKASISPRHIEVINSVFSPTQTEVDYAYEVMEAITLAKSQGKGAIALHGKMIDAPIVARAERIISAAKILGILRSGENE